MIKISQIMTEKGQMGPKSRIVREFLTKLPLGREKQKEICSIMPEFLKPIEFESNI